MSSPDATASESRDADESRDVSPSLDPAVVAATDGLDRDQLIDLVGHLRNELRRVHTELGELRGDYAEMHVQLIRARQDQEMYQRWIDRWRAVEHNAQRVEAKLVRTRRRSQQQ